MKISFYASLSLCLLLFTSLTFTGGWVPLLDKDLSKWLTYLSYRHQPGYNGNMPVNAKGEPIEPVGYNKDSAQVFSVISDNGTPVLRISGEIYGCVYTKQEFENYHLKLKVKWGRKKWPPRLNEPMDSGILYHSLGDAGVDYWRSWMQGHEFQIMEGGIGDYWCIAKTGAYIKMDKPEARSDIGYYSNNGVYTRMGAGGNRSGFVKHSQSDEKPAGQWNTVELICFGDKSIHIVNGKVVMALSGSYYVEGSDVKPLKKGRIQLQSEAAEVFFKDIQIRNIDKVPQEYRQYFDN